MGGFGDFRTRRGGRGTRLNLRPSGTGLFTATFINSAGCRNAYEALKQAHTLLFQSEPKRNRGGNQVFLCVFQYRRDDGNLPVL